MSSRIRLAACLLGVMAASAAWVDRAPADTVTEPMQKVLADLKFDAKILDGVDKELQIPQAWLDGAKREGPVILYDTIRPKEWEKIYSVFAARYPDVKIEHNEVNTSSRRYVLPLTAFKQGRHVVDVIIGLSGNAFLFRQANALEDLSTIPNYYLMPENGRQPDHITAATRVQYWCMSYNTKQVKAEEMPKTWDDLVNSDRFGDKKLMVGNRPNNWIMYLWDMNGDEWGKNYVRKLFEKLRPQLRKESLNAIVKLTALGEGQAAVPQAMTRVGELARAGSPVGYHCPEPVPFVLTELGLMKNSPRINGAKIFINWFLSKEGQITQFWANASVPARPDLQGDRFLDFPEAIAGKKQVMLSPDSSEATIKLSEYWEAMWQSAGGARER